MNEHCLICRQPLRQFLTWTSFLFPAQCEAVCRTCEVKFERIEGEICRICGRPFHGLPEKYRKGEICLDCIAWGEAEGGDVLSQNRSVYVYNDWMKEIITAFKFKGDYALVHVFKEKWKKVYKACCDRNDMIVPIPLTQQRLYERGSNQACVLAELLEQPTHDILVRRDDETQSKKTRKERLKGTQLFDLKDGQDIIGKNILLIDDIYTTGTTIRQAATVLREAGCRSVSSLTLIRG